MADEQFALSPSMTPAPTEADYQAILATVMETMRGRWFLAEYGKRNRNTDSDAILAALSRVRPYIEAMMPRARAPKPTLRLGPAVEPAGAEVVESSAPERRGPEHAEPGEAAPTALETVDPEVAGRAEPHAAEADHVERERAAAERLKPSETGPQNLGAAPPAPDHLEPEKVAPQSIKAEHSASAPAEAVMVEAVTWPDQEPALRQVPPVIAPAVAKVGAAGLERSPPEIGPLGADAAERDSGAAAPENPSRSDLAAVLEHILAIIHEPIEGPAELPVIGTPPAGQERAADCDDAVTPLTLDATPAGVAAAAPADLGVPSPDYSFAASPDRDVATPAPSATLAGIEDIPFASNSRPLTVADPVAEMLPDVPVWIEMASHGSAGPAIEMREPAAPPIEPAPTIAPALLPRREEPAPVSTLRPPHPADAPGPPPAAPPVQRVAAGTTKPPHSGLAANAALSDDDTIALFS